MAFGALRHLLDQGVSIPDQVSVAGFDDIEFAAYASVPLTTVRIPLTQFGRLGAELVFELLAGGSPDPWPSVTPELVIRGSSGRAPT
jgi:DNA-binding LacI/PurR family transcriptional regulator